MEKFCIIVISLILLIALIINYFYVIGNIVVAIKMLPKINNNLVFSNEKFNINNIIKYNPDGIDECYRNCIVGQKRICYHKFVLEHFHAMGPACGNCSSGIIEDCNHPQCIIGDGFEKGVMSINRKIPGPALHVCQDDLIIIDVVNQAAGTGATLHWHGFHMHYTPYMDGVPFLTQCPIDFSTTFRYWFWAHEPGTQFYHSHSGHYKTNGQYGGIVIRVPNGNDPNQNYYDYDLPEHLIVMSDWMHAYAEMFVPGLPTIQPGIFPDSILINGRGQYIDPLTKTRTIVPPSTKFYIRKGFRYRFRFINSASHSCPYQLQIENHNLTVIATDSFNVEPKPFTTLITNSGERYDFIVFANQPARNYLIRIRALGTCSSKPIESFAILSYVEINDEKIETTNPIYPQYNQTFPDGILLNHPNSSCGEEKTNEHCVSELVSTKTDNELRYSVPDERYYLGFSMQSISNDEVYTSNSNNWHSFANVAENITLIGTINRLSHVFPSFPLLTQSEQLNEIDFCEQNKIPDRCKDYKICPCVHRIKIKLNSIVELIVVDETATAGSIHHPFHLHGFEFMIVGLGKHPQGIPMTVELAQNLDRQKALPRLSFNPRPPFKDTVSIPSKGYAILHFRADNPGFWLMHCHYEWHFSTGMGLILQVGEPKDMIQPPPNFPRCGNYLPNIDKIAKEKYKL